MKPLHIIKAGILVMCPVVSSFISRDQIPGPMPGVGDTRVIQELMTMIQ